MVLPTPSKGHWWVSVFQTAASSMTESRKGQMNPPEHGPHQNDDLSSKPLSPAGYHLALLLLKITKPEVMIVFPHVCVALSLLCDTLLRATLRSWRGWSRSDSDIFKQFVVSTWCSCKSHFHLHIHSNQLIASTRLQWVWEGQLMFFFFIQIYRFSWFSYVQLPPAIDTPPDW